MKSIVKNLVAGIVAIFVISMVLGSCVEPRYYNEYNHHSRDWYGRRHQNPPPGVNFEIDVFHRRGDRHGHHDHH